MRILFWGTPEFAAEVLKTLINSKHQVIAVITQPDKPKGRGQKVTPPPVKEIAIKHNIPVYQPEKLKNNQEIINIIKELNPDISVVVAYGKIIPKEILDIPKYKTINIHASILPKYRGAAPIHRAIMEGEKETGVSIMELVEKLDAGPVYAIEKIEITDEDDIISLHDKLAKLGSQLLLKVLDDIQKGATATPQDESKATYAKPIEKEEGLIDWSKPATEIFNKIRALKVWPKAYTNFRGEQIKILDATPLNEEYAGDYGEIVKIENGIVVKTGKGSLLIKQLQFPNSKPISTLDAVRGYHIKVGEKFG
ncbi:methionyl-tRNA formyltransferase [Venenivibrio stagnispumantis]|uniref:Methionyl-tRNA formyltransferase n=1 Tax=Venenivibrio stagnispumantis TaxID=407998 RepID=A0AA45WL30_9AQUI|nr:methionyl-tRNA formyltransferase [Venenivibrio stagnispumantis]MCW4573681.1 methionyl-tRNA formyltransferase [Venenivibrio stagnispumantis]SMP09916.1 methionyl-tRNA formyltransferase [Venenivibrio stagnispumantis]